jgi:hypothetical protein
MWRNIGGPGRWRIHPWVLDEVPPTEPAELVRLWELAAAAYTQFHDGKSEEAVWVQADRTTSLSLNQIDDKWKSVLTGTRPQAPTKVLERSYWVLPILAELWDDPEVVRDLPGRLPKGSVRIDTSEPEPAPRKPPEIPATLPARPTLKMLDDQPLDQEDGPDDLNFRKYADALAALLTHPETKFPFVLSINAPWGAGKTSLANLIRRRVTAQDPVTGAPKCLSSTYNAWLNDDAKSLAGSLTGSVAREVANMRPFWRKVLCPVPLDMLPGRQKGWVYGIIFALSVVAVVAMYTLSAQKPEFTGAFTWLTGLEAGKAVGSLALAGGLLAGARKLLEMGTGLQKFIRDPQQMASEGRIGAARSQLGALIDQATAPRRKGQLPRRYILFIDDLERCPPPRAIELLDAVNQLLGHPQVGVVLLGDMAAVAAHAGMKYEKLAEEYDPLGHGMEGAAARRAYGRLYIQKIVQMQFDLPPHREEAIRRMLDRLTKPDDAAMISPAVSQSITKTLKYFEDEQRRQNSLVGRFVRSDLFSFLLGSVVIVSGLALGLAALGWLSGLFPEQFGISFFPEVGARIGAGVGLVLTLLGAVGQYLTHRDTKKREALANSVQKEAEKVAMNPGDNLETVAKRIADSVQGKSGLAAEIAFQQATEAIRRQRMGETDELREAYQAALSLLPLLPRNAKRLINMLRVRIYLAHSLHWMNRDLPSGIKVTPAHIGKWTALQERYPDLALLIMREPKMVLEMEDCAGKPDDETKKQRFAELAGMVPKREHPRLRDIFAGEPKLNGVIGHLVFMPTAVLETLTETSPAPSPN